eukprot:CAMPEP_0180771024 /NCGR_PEP_ID=MMETSP1038_2-20121128/41952_1 /TAXON_ID=632150 /ORGANISM="Azadinium spinosum, Strain 3D9" /LENGTH=223 /DNA_ID=CAMNT_0022805863 /DNA_START=221 /DNA_END=890 /DNA_ORIENTATION=+
MEERVPEVVATSGVETGDERGLDLPVLAMSRSTEDLPEVHGCACQRHRTCGRTARGRGPTADLLRLCGERVHSSGEGFVPPSLRAWFPCRRGGSTSRRKLLVQSAYLRVAGRVQARLVDGDKLGGPRRGLRGHEVGRRPGAQHVVGLRDPAVAAAEASLAEKPPPLRAEGTLPALRAERLLCELPEPPPPPVPPKPTGKVEPFAGDAGGVALRGVLDSEPPLP